MIEATGGVKFLKQEEVLVRYGISRSTLYRLIGRGLFPAAKKISEGVNRWALDDLEDFDNNLPIARFSNPDQINLS